MTQHKIYPLIEGVGTWYIFAIVALLLYLAIFNQPAAILRDVLVIIGAGSIVSSFFQLFTNSYARRTRSYVPLITLMPYGLAWPDDRTMRQYKLKKSRPLIAWPYAISAFITSFLAGVAVAGLMP